VNVFERTLQIIEERGWHQGDRTGPDGERCLLQAFSEASAEVHPWREPRRFTRRREAKRFALMSAHRARATHEARVLRAACEEVNGVSFWGGEYVWNDDPARSEEDIRLALKVAARNLEDATQRQSADGSS
jgi:hypothetical protein